ncbi:GAF domain-containing protein [Brumimicrobium salinarum]|nr:GAF domain-containing protein [Brumimicrobium salinarum]
MSKKEIQNIDLKNFNEGDAQSFLIDVIHKFSQDIIAAETTSDIFHVLVNDVAKQMALKDCVLYKVNREIKQIEQIATYRENKFEDGQIKNALTLNFGEGHAGLVAETGSSLLIKDVSKSKNYKFDVSMAGSELVIPVKINDEVYAVISSEHPEPYFYTEYHLKLWDVIASIATGALVKIHKKEELVKIQHRLEDLLDKQSEDLDKAIEMLSDQFAKLKQYREKQETLMQEIHHRVTNNLQIISSILRLYMSKDTVESVNTLNAIHNRVQVMALIHQNIYKTMESGMVGLNSYMSDLLNYLKSTTSRFVIGTGYEVEINFLSIDVLVSFGLYITEVFYMWVDLADQHGLEAIELRFEVLKTKDERSFEINIYDQSKIALFENVDFHSTDEMGCILISALTDQLEGELSYTYENQNRIRLTIMS